MRKIFSLLIIFMLLTTSVFGLEATDEISAGITPDNPLYIIDKGVEKAETIIIETIASDDAAAELHLELAEERVAEHLEITDKIIIEEDTDKKEELEQHLQILSEEAELEDVKAELFGQKISDAARRKDFDEKRTLILDKRETHIEDKIAERVINDKEVVELEKLLNRIEDKRAEIGFKERQLSEVEKEVEELKENIELERKRLRELEDDAKSVEAVHD